MVEDKENCSGVESAHQCEELLKKLSEVTESVAELPNSQTPDCGLLNIDFFQSALAGQVEDNCSPMDELTIASELEKIAIASKLKEKGLLDDAEEAVE